MMQFKRDNSVNLPSSLPKLSIDCHYLCLKNNNIFYVKQPSYETEQYKIFF